MNTVLSLCAVYCHFLQIQEVRRKKITKCDKQAGHSIAKPVCLQAMAECEGVSNKGIKESGRAKEAWRLEPLTRLASLLGSFLIFNDCYLRLLRDICYFQRQFFCVFVLIFVLTISFSRLFYRNKTTLC